jgi:hypothetical protein
MSKPMRKHPLMLMMNVPSGKLRPHRWPIQTASAYREIADKATDTDNEIIHRSKTSRLIQQVRSLFYYIKR